jgi:hypothetical protein
LTLFIARIFPRSSIIASEFRSNQSSIFRRSSSLLQSLPLKEIDISLHKLQIAPELSIPPFML